MKLRMATRRSALALAQSRAVAAALCAQHPGLAVEEVLVVTEGDRIVDRSLAALGGKGLFVTEVEQCLAEGRADFAVHSMKDLPAEVGPGCVVAAVPLRESPDDLLVTVDGRALDQLAKGARVGTSSRRRELQLLAVRPDLQISLLRGNVDTRLRRLAQGDFDAVVLAAAGVRRLGVEVRASSLRASVVPAVAQGALALEARVDDASTRSLLSVLHHERSSLETSVERSMLRALSGSCVTPMGAHAALAEDGSCVLEAFLATDDGSKSARARETSAVRDEDSAAELGLRAAKVLRERLG